MRWPIRGCGDRVLRGRRELRIVRAGGGNYARAVEEKSPLFVGVLWDLRVVVGWHADCGLFLRNLLCGGVCGGHTVKCLEEGEERARFAREAGSSLRSE